MCEWAKAGHNRSQFTFNTFVLGVLGALIEMLSHF